MYRGRQSPIHDFPRASCGIHGDVDRFRAYGLLLVPSLLFMVAASAVLHSVARQKHLAHAVGIALAGAFYSLIARGVNHPSFNLLLYDLWTPESLNARWLLAHRVYTCGVAAVLTWTAIRFMKRKV